MGRVAGLGSGLFFGPKPEPVPDHAEEVPRNLPLKNTLHHVLEP